MKKLIFCLIASIVLAMPEISAKIWGVNMAGQPERVVFKPDYLARLNGSLYIDRIEFFKDSTLVKCTSYYYPGAKITVDRNLVIRCGEKVIKPVALRGMEFGKPFTLLRSGRHMFTVVYPPIDKKEKVADLCEIGGSWSIYGLRLDGERYDRVSPDKWVEENTFYYPGELKNNLIAEPKPAIIKGILGGFDAKVLNDNFTIANYDPITGVEDDYVAVVGEDGSFEVDVPTRSLRYVTLMFPLNMNTQVLLEPGRTSTIYFDRNKILAQRSGAADIYQSAIYDGGELGMINTELQAAYVVWTPSDVMPLEKVKSLKKALLHIDNIHEAMVDKIMSYCEMCAVTPYTQKLLLANEKAGMILALLNTEARLTSEAGVSGRMLPDLPEDYYSFIKQDLDNELIWFAPKFKEVARKLSESRLGEVIGLRYNADDGDVKLSKDKIVAELVAEANALCSYLGVDTPPVWWQIMTAMKLASFGKMPREKTSAETAKYVLSGLKKNGVIKNAAVYNSLNEYYRY